MSDNEAYTVIYWAGGTVAGEWRKCLPVATFAQAKHLIEGIRRAGRVAWWLPKGMDMPDGPPDAEDFAQIDSVNRPRGADHEPPARC
jgi:hypothetical protein